VTPFHNLDFGVGGGVRLTGSSWFYGSERGKMAGTEKGTTHRLPLQGKARSLRKKRPCWKRTSTGGWWESGQRKNTRQEGKDTGLLIGKKSGKFTTLQKTKNGLTF